MKKTDINIMIAGSAGEGIQTVGSMLSRSLQKLGYALFSWQEYESRIRGGLNSYSIRITEEVINSPRMDVDILLSLNPKAVDKYGHFVNTDGIIIGDGAQPPSIEISFNRIAVEKWKNPVYANTIALGALWAALGADIGIIQAIVEKSLTKKGEAVVKRNIEALLYGYELAEKSCKGICPWKVDQRREKFYLINGQPAIALGAARAGCRFMCAYPMTPSTGIITYLAQHEDSLKIFTEQAEDEISAINMAIGAQFAGCRAMTATSGGGFALMVEAVSLAGMTETPVVIILAQRPGPATGLPTRTAQGDLLFAIHAGHGEFPKCVLAPSDPYEAFHLTIEAFNLADRFQIPVIIITDQFLADSQFSISDFELQKSIPEYFFANPDEYSNYKRYKITPDGISPRLFPGQSKHVVTADSDEHDEYGHITEDLLGTALPMTQKRLKKIQALRKAMRSPEQFLVDDAEEVFISWGSTKYSVREAVNLLRKEGKKIGHIHFSYLWPLPEFSFPEDKNLIVVEQNATAQFGKLLACEYGVKISDKILKYDGLPFTANWIRRNYYG